MSRLPIKCFFTLDALWSLEPSALSLILYFAPSFRKPAQLLKPNRLLVYPGTKVLSH